ncbi:MAG: hypothetical protein R3E91_06075 [Chlamydiales bacterium]
MKKYILAFLIILTTGVSHALPVSNPADPCLICDGLFLEGHCGDPSDPSLTWLDTFSVRFGFYGNYVFNRHMEVDSSRYRCDIEETKINTNAGFLACNFWDYFDIFATFGGTNILINTNEQAFALNGSGRFQIETNTQFSWSIGVRTLIWDCGSTTLGAEAQYFYTKPNISRLTQTDSLSIYPNELNGKYQEWQIGLGISHRINLLVPYIAIKFSQSQLQFNHTIVDGFFNEALPAEAILYNLGSKKRWGYTIGVSFVNCEKISLTAEGDWGDEKGAYLSSQIRF